jgi:hypothetical protein
VLTGALFLALLRGVLAGTPTLASIFNKTRIIVTSGPDHFVDTRDDGRLDDTAGILRTAMIGIGQINASFTSQAAALCRAPARVL